MRRDEIASRATHALLCVLLISVSPLTTEFFAPAMREASRERGMPWVEHTLSLYFLIMSLLHALHGALASAIGSLLCALYGLVLYAASSFALCLVSSSAIQSTFYALRAAQAVGASACTVAGYGHIKDHLSAHDRVADFHLGRSLLLVVGPMSSQLLLDHSSNSWQAPFCLMGQLGAVGAMGAMLAMCGPRLLASKRGKSAFAPPRSAEAPDAFEMSRRDRVARFALWVAAEAFGFSSLFVWVSGAHAFFVEDGFGYAYGLTFSGSVVGSSLARPVDQSRQARSFCVASAGACLVLATVVLAKSWETDLPFDVETFVCGAITAFNICRSYASARACGGALSSSSRGVAASGILHAARMATTAATIEITPAMSRPLAMLLYASASLACGLAIVHLQALEARAWRLRVSMVEVSPVEAFDDE